MNKRSPSTPSQFHKKKLWLRTTFECHFVINWTIIEFEFFMHVQHGYLYILTSLLKRRNEKKKIANKPVQIHLHYYPYYLCSLIVWILPVLFQSITQFFRFVKKILFWFLKVVNKIVVIDMCRSNHFFYTTKKS